MSKNVSFQRLYTKQKVVKMTNDLYVEFWEVVFITKSSSTQPNQNPLNFQQQSVSNFSSAGFLIIAVSNSKMNVLWDIPHLQEENRKCYSRLSTRFMRLEKYTYFYVFVNSNEVLKAFLKIQQFKKSLGLVFIVDEI